MSADAATTALTDNHAELQLCDADVTGNDVTHGGVGSSPVRPSSTFSSRQRQTGSGSGGSEAARLQRGLTTADFSQQTVQDCATAVLHLRCLDVDEALTPVRFLNVSHDVVTSCDEALTVQPCWARLTDTAGVVLYIHVYGAKKRDNNNNNNEYKNNITI